MKYRYVVLVLSLLVAGTAQAETVKPGPMDDGVMDKPRSVFAFPGKECPAASHKYGGPSQLDIEKQGAVYCVFDNTYVWLKKDINKGKCPDGGDPVYAGEKPKDYPYIWCLPPKDAAEFIKFIGALQPKAVAVGTATPPKPVGVPDPIKNPPLITPIGPVKPLDVAPLGTQTPKIVPNFKPVEAPKDEKK